MNINNLTPLKVKFSKVYCFNSMVSENKENDSQKLILLQMPYILLLCLEMNWSVLKLLFLKH